MESKKVVEIVFILDEGFVIPTAAAITSLVENKNSDTNYKINLVTSNLSALNIDKFKKYKDESTEINIIEANGNKYKNFHKYDKSKPCCATVSALFKFELPNLLPDLDKVLFLDGDILIQKDLLELFETDIEDNYAAAIKDSGRIYYKIESTQHIENYFNSGVMLLNLKKMRNDNMTQKLIEAKQNSKDMSLMDQNIFNILFEGKVKFLDIKYNFLYLNLVRSQKKYSINKLNDMYLSNYSNINEIKEKAYIVHFSSKDKPWKYSNIIGSKEWFEYYKKSYFYDEKNPIKRIKNKKLSPILAPLDNLIISLTSYPARINTVNQTIESLINQTLKPEKIILWLSYEQFPNKENDLPKQLLDLTSKGLTIEWCEDIKSYKKLIPALKKYPDKVIITADDDIIYEEDRIEKLYKDYLKNPNMIHCHRAHRILFNKKQLLPYSSWYHRIKNVKPSFNNFFTGAGCVLYPINCFYKDILNQDLYMKLCPQADDIWFWAMAVLNNYKINVVEENYKGLNYVEGYFNDVFDDSNDVQINSVLEYYPKIIKRLDKSNVFYENIFEEIFSVKNFDIYKVVTILGLKLRFKIKKLKLRNRLRCIETEVDRCNSIIQKQQGIILSQKKELEFLKNSMVESVKI